MNETAERAAKAIAKVRECEPTVEQVASCIWGHDNVEGYSCICLVAARAAIEAIIPQESIAKIVAALEAAKPIVGWVSNRDESNVQQADDASYLIRDALVACSLLGVTMGDRQ